MVVETRQSNQPRRSARLSVVGQRRREAGGDRGGGEAGQARGNTARGGGRGRAGGRHRASGRGRGQDGRQQVPHSDSSSSSGEDWDDRYASDNIGSSDTGKGKQALQIAEYYHNRNHDTDDDTSLSERSEHTDSSVGPRCEQFVEDLRLMEKYGRGEDDDSSD